MELYMKYLRLFRIKHWIKNLLLFFPIIFSGQLFEQILFCRVVKGFFAFGFMASVIYIFNDLKDLEMDRNNPAKQNRPLASGLITRSAACIWMIVLFLAAEGICYFAGLGFRFWICLNSYLIMNIAYSMGMKHVPIVDVTILSGGYLLRLYAGGAVAECMISDWMFLTVTAASFYLGFGKRRNELLRYGDRGRKILSKYTIAFLDKGVQMFLTLTVVFYALCCADKNTAVARSGVNLLWSVFVVILVLMRYHMLLEDGEGDGDPVEVVQKDKVILGLVFFYAISVMALIYLGGGGKKIQRL